MERGLVAEIDLQAVSHNFGVIRQMTGGRPVIAVVKADAYGHGAVEVSKRLVGDGAEYLAVAFMNEAIQLREAGISAPILVLFDPDVKEAFEYNLTPVVGTLKAAYDLSREAVRRGRHITVHIKVDSGMGRLGLRCVPDNCCDISECEKVIIEISRLQGINIEGMMSHFCDADLKYLSFARSQISVFDTLRKNLSAAGLHIPVCHLANSAAVMSLPEAHYDAVRPGIMLYGCSPLDGVDRGLVPAMSVKARILALRKLPPGTSISYGRTFVTARESLVAVMSAGYADGFNRLFSNNAAVLVKGRKAPVVGRVCMDITMVDVTEIADVSEMDEVIIMGGRGEERIGAEDLARWSNTIPYEVMLSIGSKAKRIYI
ncbi:MAG: alanine racemase [Nitrospirae bacterium]|nr:alanine racemase [Nitrospirota bacterium]